MTKIQVQSEIDTQSLLFGVAQMPLSELEYFSREVNALILRRQTLDVHKQEKNLLSNINKTAFPRKKAERYAFLADKLEPNTLSDAEHTEFMDLVTEEEALRNERVKYLIQLAQLRNMPLLKLMDSLDLNHLANG